MADDIDVRRLRLQSGDILSFQTDQKLSADEINRIGVNLRALLDAAGHSDVPIWLSSGGCRLTVISPANDLATADGQ